MKAIVVVLALSVLGAAAAEAQDQGHRTTRIHLRNGNCVEGRLVGETGKGWTLRMSTGEVTVRHDLVARLETLRMKSLAEPEPLPPVVVTPAPVSAAAPKPARTSPPARKKDLLKALESGIEGRSAEVVRNLGGLNPEDLELVTAAICDSGDPSALAPAQEMLTDPRGELRAAAVRIIAAHGGFERRFDFRSMSEDPDPLVRRWVITSLAAVDDVTAFDLIGFRLIDSDASVRADARTALFALSNRHQTGDDLLRLFLEKLYVSEDQACAEILAAVGSCGNREAWEPVARYLDDRNPSVRAQAALALSRMGAPESADVLVNRLELEQEYWPRIQLAGAVQTLKLKKAVDPLLAWMEEDDQNIRMAAVRALRQITLQSFGMDRDRWVAWWQDAKPRE